MRAYGSSVLRYGPIVIAVGGAAGSGARWLVINQAGHHAFPWSTLAVNIVGAFILGLLVHPAPTEQRELIRLGVGVGFCGGLTTFSSVALSLAEQLRDGRSATAGSYLLASVVVGVAAVAAGAMVRRLVDPEPVR